MSVEERLAILEKELAELKHAQLPPQNWLKKITGTFKDDPEFGEILRLGREIRQAENIDDSDGDA